MYDPIKEPFYPLMDKKGKVVLVPMETVLLGETEGKPYHPDQAIFAFLSYLPSLFLQVLEPELNEEEWVDLVLKGSNSSFFEKYQEKVKTALDKKKNYFRLFANQDSFYQHYSVKNLVEKGSKDAKLVVGMDGLLSHSVTGNNHCHHKQPNVLKKICPACALTTLIHHNYFCVAGLAGPSNLRGNQAYLCMISREEENLFTKMIANIYLTCDSNKEELANRNWNLDPEADAPSWIRSGKKQGKKYKDKFGEIGLIRSMLYTPRKAFLEIEEEECVCDFCQQKSDKSVQQYYWAQGEEKPSLVFHPTLACYLDSKGQTLPQNYNPSVWQNLGSLSLKEYNVKKGENNAKSDLTFHAAPLVSQFSDFISEKKKSLRQYSIELQAYQTDKAKLLGFHHQKIELPFFSYGKKALAVKFYKKLEAYSSCMSQMLSVFRSSGIADKKKSKVAIPNIQDRHSELTQRWGTELLNSVYDYWELFPKEKGADDSFFNSKMRETLENQKKFLNREFDKLAEYYDWDDLKSQKKLKRQKSYLAGSMIKILKTFEKQDQ